MKTLSLILLCLLSVGAWGQTGIVTTEAIVFEPPNPYTCTCTFSADGSSMSCAPAKACAKFIHADEDVPAIPEIVNDKIELPACRARCSAAEVCTCPASPQYRLRIKWVCRDKAHRTLMQTDDGKTHYCHNAQLESK